MSSSESSYYRSTANIFIINLLLGIPGGMGLALLSPYIENLFFLNGAANFAVVFAFLLMSLHVLMKGISSPICGYFSDNKGRRYTLLIGGVISIIGSSMIFISTFNILVLVIIGFLLVGSGRGFFMTTFNVMAGDIGEKFNKIGHAESFCDGLYVIGAILGGSITLITEEYFIVFLISFILFVVVFLILYFTTKETLDPALVLKNDEKVTLKSIIQNENFYPTLLFAFTVEGAESGYIAWTVPLIIAGFAEITRAALFSTFPFSLGLGLFFILAGFINDKQGRKNTALLGSGLMILFSIMAIFFMVSPLLIFLIVFFFSGSSAFIRSTIESTWSDISNLKTRGMTYGYFRFFNELGGVIQPLIVALLIFIGLPFYWSALLITIFACCSFIIGKIYFKETMNPSKS